MSLKHLIRLARPEHWVKNVIVLLPVVFAKRYADGWAWAAAGVAAAAFCLASSAVYVLNDIADRQADRLHPRKRRRPLASGQVGVPAAAIEAAVLLAAAGATAAAAGRLVVLLVAAYVALQVAYSLYLKGKMLTDAISIALGFVLRAVAGAVAIRVPASPWLVVCTFTLCLFMGFCKRRGEVLALGSAEAAGEHRPTLRGYTPELLTHLITLSAGIAIVSFLIYTLDAGTVARFGTTYLAYTLPLVVYGVCRFAMLSMSGRYGDPTELILRDRAFQATAVLWAAAVLAIIAYGPAVRAWVESWH